MDNSTFRWVLIIVGVALLAGIFLFGNPERKRKPRASRKRKRNRIREAEATQAAERLEPTLEPGPDSGEDGEESLTDPDQVELAIDPLPPEADMPPPPPPGPPPEKILVLLLQARDNHRISGLDLLDAALKSGMEFGQQDVFHRMMDDSDQPIFSMANLTKPGHFDKSSWNTLETKGVTMFLTLPGPMNSLDAWDAMLATSRRLAELLHADLMDQNKEVFTRLREGEIREELREYERQKLPEG